MEHEIAFVVERGLVAANVGEGFAAQYLVDEFGEGGGVHRIRLVARQAADDGVVCAVAFAGEGERAVHMGAEAGNFIQRNRTPARIGPTVCELDGPMPILNMSKMLIIIFHPFHS